MQLLLRVMVLSQPATFGLVLGLNVLMQAGQMVRPLLLQYLLAEDNALVGFMYVAVLVFLYLCHVVITTHWYYADAQNSANIRALLMMTVFRFGLLKEQTPVQGARAEHTDRGAKDAGADGNQQHLDPSAQSKSQPPLPVPSRRRDVGKLTNLMATDADRISGAAVCLRLTNWTLNTLRLPYTVWMLYLLLGQAGLVGVGAVIAVHVASYLNGKCMAVSMRQIQEARDEKSSMASAMLRGFKIIRLHGCEEAWRTQIERSRERELQCTIRYRLINVG
eukprot:COSAG01_NODE_3199_length_6426_cov_6.255726_1_plen_276_part_10